jgi:putative YhbY family RNA-binding protein
MTQITLTPARRKALQGEAHDLKPVVMVGADGLTPAVMKEADNALTSHGLIKVRVFSDDREARGAMLLAMADELNAAPVQHIGKLLVLHRPIPKVKKEVSEEERKLRPRRITLVTPSKSGERRPKVQKVTLLGNERVTRGGSIKRAKPARQTSTKKRGS